MAHKKQGGKTTQHVRPSGKRLGVKATDGQKVNSGEVLIRQRGTVFAPGKNVKVGRDHTLYSNVAGVVKYSQKYGKKYVSIVS